MKRTSHGFTLIETVFVIAILGFAITSLMALLGAVTIANKEAADLSVASRLAKSVHEFALTLSHARRSGSLDDIVDLNGKSFTPPVDSRGQAMSGNFAGWTQKVQVLAVDPDTLSDVSGAIADNQPKRLIVTVQHNNKNDYVQEWLLCPLVQ